ncbi:hypothetical protein CYY_000342 [Polysphondylium violaceum]|uniref:Dihydrolipoamide acetyltransferase component of pyruvate dehydrogenase complex n=1 Tax=Polysphondylium violaceum TaxID=133409 RepID=A0A8J4V5Q5_9MYCE|nr:hypothetical protein CYY_000342 [Polysphondylium violaceum]
MFSRQLVRSKSLISVIGRRSITNTTVGSLSTKVNTRVSSNNNNSFNNKLVSSINVNSNLVCGGINTIRSFSTSRKPIQFNLADVGEGIAECEVLNWHFKEGDSIKEFDKLCDVQSDKATVEITSRYDGIITKIYHKVGDMAKVGSPLVDILQEGSSEDVAAVTIQETTTTTKTTTIPVNNASHDNHEHNEITNKSGEKIKILATPSVRHLAKVNKLNLNQVSGTGKDGRVLKEDLLNHLSGKSTTTTTCTASSKSTTIPSTPVAAAPVATIGSNTTTTVPITGIRKAMVKTMNAASAVPHFGFSEEYIMDKLTELRSQLKPIAESRGIKLSYMPFLIKACSLALSRYPVLNSSISQSQTEIIYKNYHNIGVAIDTPQGLLVPNIKNVESKSIFEIAQELNRLQKEGAKGTLTPADMSGGTFSLSNIGTIGGTYCSPVLLLPEVCIGAIGKIQKLPRFDKHGNVYPCSVMIISWSGDHRIIDGATIANFSNLLKSYIEQPNTMLLDTK